MIALGAQSLLWVPSRHADDGDIHKTYPQAQPQGVREPSCPIEKADPPLSLHTSGYVCLGQRAHSTHEGWDG